MIVLLPLGSIEAHGPHLPLDTDTRIAALLARRCAEALRTSGVEARVAEPFTRTACSFARGLPGTVDVSADEERAAMALAIRDAHGEGASRVVLVNLHFDPEHMRAVRDCVAQIERSHPGLVVFPDFTRRINAQRIGGEFATGACHGGEFETSLLLVAAPEAVSPSFRALPAHEVDLARAIREGKRSFRELGLAEGYCGHPAAATAAEGERLLGVLAEILLGACSGKRPS